MTDKVMELCYKIHALAAFGGCAKDQRKEIEETTFQIYELVKQYESC